MYGLIYQDIGRQLDWSLHGSREEETPNDKRIVDCILSVLQRMSTELTECNDNLKVRLHYAVRQNATTHCSFAAQQKLLGICR